MGAGARALGCYEAVDLKGNMIQLVKGVVNFDVTIVIII